MSQQLEIWACDKEREDLWGAEPTRAAMLAYLEVVSLWHEQVEAGTYRGIPALHRVPESSKLIEFEPSTQRSRPVRYQRDDSAGHWRVPDEVKQRFLVAA